MGRACADHGQDRYRTDQQGGADRNCPSAAHLVVARAREQAAHPTVEPWSGGERRRRQPDRRGRSPMGDDHQTARQTEAVAGAGRSALVGQVLGNLLEAATYQPIEGLEHEQPLTETIEELPGGVATGEVGDFVREEPCLVLTGKLVHPFGTADLRLSDSRCKGHRDGFGSADFDMLPKTHRRRQSHHEVAGRLETPGSQQSFEIEDRSKDGGEGDYCGQSPEHDKRRCPAGAVSRFGAGNRGDRGLGIDCGECVQHG
jgi:hypothetical protein